MQQRPPGEFLWLLQVQCSVQAGHPAVGPEALQHHRGHREVVVGSKPLDLPGGCVRGRRHRQAAASGQDAGAEKLIIISAVVQHHF